MALQNVNWLEISNLASLLRESGDRVLSGNSKLRLTPTLLSKLNAAFLNISLLSSNGDFQVTSAHAAQLPSTAHIQFLHDFVQKTVGLTIAGNNNDKNDQHKLQPIDLTRFRSLKHLEIRGCTFSPGLGNDQGLTGLLPLRHQLEALVLIQVFCSNDLLWEVLADSAVSIGPDVVWTKLSQLVVSYCRLRTLGTSLSLVCNLQWMDVSHNELSDANAISSGIAALPNLCYLNLSYNRLNKIPVPSYVPFCPIPNKIQILLLSHNYIENLNGIQHLTSLRELNLEVNQLRSHSALQYIRSLYQLQHVKLRGNPISYHKQHRILASSYFPPRAVFMKHRYRRDAVKLCPFMLDGQKLTEPELQAVRDGPLCSNLSKSDHVSVDMSEQSNKAPESSGNSSSDMERSSRRSRKIREVIIEDFDTLEELTDKNFNSNQTIGSIESSGEHLQTKKQLENVRAHFKEDWLRAHAGCTVQELLGLQPASGLLGSSVASITSSARPLSSSTPIGSPGLSVRLAPYPGHLDEQQVLESIISRRSPESRDALDVSQTTQSTTYYSAVNSDTVIHASPENDETLRKEEGPFSGYDADEDEDVGVVDDLTPPKDTEEPVDGDHQATYIVTKVTKNKHSPRDIFLVTTSRYIKEIDLNSGSVIQHWRLHSLESCVLLSVAPCQVQLTFKTVVPSKKERIYEMDPNEAQKQLLPSLKSILETQSLSALNVAAFRCMHCSGEFSVELNSRKASKLCPTCGSTLVFELDEAPLPSLGSSSLVSPKVPFSTTSELAVAAEPSQELLHSPSDSSIGSAVSLESPGSVVQAVSDYTPNVNPSMRRCESDIDIISNPSQSSIEILDDVSRTSGTPGRKRSSEERQVVAIPSLVTVPEVSNPLSPLLAGLTESSSSGSITDSVCTAYENNTGTGGMGVRRGAYGLAKSALKEESSRENSPRYQEELDKTTEPVPQATSAMSNVLDNLLQTMSSKISASETLEKKLRVKNAVLDSFIQYNYVDFSAVDHRLKLHLHLSILDADEREVVQCLFRGEVFTFVQGNRYPGILLISSQKVYVMKITGPEDGDAVDRWISRVVAVPLEKLYSITALPWGTGILLSFQGAPISSLIFVVRDQTYSQNFLTFLTELSDKPEFEIVPWPTENHTQLVEKVLQDFVENAIPEAHLTIELAVLLCSHTVSKDDEDECNAGGSLIVTRTHLLLNDEDVTWLLLPEISAPSSLSMESYGKQSISNLIVVEAEGLELCFQFLDEAAGSMELWKLTVESDAVLEQIISAIRGPWEDLFSVPLQVSKT